MSPAPGLISWLVACRRSWRIFIRSLLRQGVAFVRQDSLDDWPTHVCIYIIILYNIIVYSIYIIIIACNIYICTYIYIM